MEESDKEDWSWGSPEDLGQQ